ncbi:hypothetical protein V6N12_027574 [Hibiscus sabdariffa]|uniref:Uncharacterized protein n=1 Tax=Hibiscus sabdariffa TaxID=183260 RepID=A0ABR2F3B8_9ROSI
MAFTCPKFIVLKCDRDNQYLSYCRKYTMGQVICLETMASSPFAKFEAERPFHYAATADKPEEDQSKESCTLFKLISVDAAANKI